MEKVVLNNSEANRDINQIIDSVSQKFGYSEELNKTLKRIVPYMVKGKSEEVKDMLFDTLNRVKIFVLPNNATKEDVDRCQAEVFGDTNKDVKFVEQDRGEYGKGVAAGAYVNEPVFSDEMNITGRQGFIYITELSKYDKLAEVYGTNINVSHLIHELGHAMASEKEEFVQDENGNYVNNVGACKITCKVDKENKTVISDGYDGLFIEETLNTIEEENVLCDMLGIESINELKAKGYVPSSYQGMMTDIMKSYVEKFGKERFDDFRFLKDREALKDIDKAIMDTEGWSFIQTDEYEKKKRAKFAKVNELETTEGAKRSINNLFSEYDDVYFPDNSKFTPMQKLENVFAQVYNFGSVKYNFDIMKPQNLEIYKEVVRSMINEGYVLKNQAKEIPKREEQVKEESGFLSELKQSVKSDEEVVKEENKVSDNKSRDTIEKEIN